MKLLIRYLFFAYLTINTVNAQIKVDTVEISGYLVFEEDAKTIKKDYHNLKNKLKGKSFYKHIDNQNYPHFYFKNELNSLKSIIFNHQNKDKYMYFPFITCNAWLRRGLIEKLSLPEEYNKSQSINESLCFGGTPLLKIKGVRKTGYLMFIILKVSV